jgi:transposase-like protein
MQHLMCFFHVKQACQKQLHGKPMKDQKEMLKDITELHLCASFEEYNTLYHRVFAKWCVDYNEFAYYFEQQWNTGTDFTNWKVFSCKPGVCTTNNALESFNAMFKHSYTNHSRHTLPALLDIIMEALIVDLSREIMHGHKVFHNKHKPDRLSFGNANTITTDIQQYILCGH